MRPLIGAVFACTGYLSAAPALPDTGHETEEAASACGLTLVQDQKADELIMWIPAGFACLLTIAVPFVHWLQAAEQRFAAWLARLAPLAGLGVLLVLGGCGEQGMAAKYPSIGDPDRGAAEIAAVGCGSCHIIPGIANARGLVGPPLDHMGRRIFIAGLLRNTPDNLVTWLRDPQAVVPGNAMPDMGLSDEQARNITAYLYTLE